MNFSRGPATLGVHDETERSKRTLRRLTLDVSGMLEKRNVSVENERSTVVSRTEMNSRRVERDERARRQREEWQERDRRQRRSESTVSELPLPKALAYVLGFPSAVVGFGILEGVDGTPDTYLGIWLLFAGMAAAGVRSASKDWLFWIGAIILVATAVFFPR